MDISIFLNPVNKDLLDSNTLYLAKQIGNSIDFYNNDDINIEDYDIAIIGINEDRNSVDNAGCKDAPDVIRQALYPLYNHWKNVKIIDLGNIKTGFNIEDTYYAINQVFLTLLKNHVIPIVLGGSQDLTFPLYQAYENTGKLVNITAIDSCFDIGHDKEEINSKSYLSYIVLHQPNYLFNFTNIGYQTYFNDDEVISLMKKLFFDACRLGNAHNNITLTEPLLRNADIVSIDISAFKASDAPGIKRCSPNGFLGEEGCQMTRYAGLSNKLSSIGFFEYNPNYDINNMTAKMISQMIWYFIEGFSNRIDDIPTPESEDFIKYIVQIEEQEEMVFLCHKLTEKWWIDLSFKSKENEMYQRHHYIPCSKQDYDQAMHNEVPDRWWQYYQKLM